MEKPKGTLENYLLKNQQKNTSKVVKEGTKNAKLAKLDYEVIKYEEKANLEQEQKIIDTEELKKEYKRIIRKFNTLANHYTRIKTYTDKEKEHSRDIELQ